MNPLQRKAKTVEMTKSTDHRDVSGGLGRRLWRLLPYAALVAVVAAVPVATGSAAGSSLPKPGGLKTFVKRLDEPRKLSADGAPQYTRTPSFAWRPVRGATRYEFELSTSKRFRADNGVIWSSKTLTTPAAAVPISLPWITGPSLYWHVRAIGSRGISQWSATGRFNMRWTEGVPKQLPERARLRQLEADRGSDRLRRLVRKSRQRDERWGRRHRRQDRLDDHHRRG